MNSDFIGHNLDAVWTWWTICQFPKRRWRKKLSSALILQPWSQPCRMLSKPFCKGKDEDNKRRSWTLSWNYREIFRRNWSSLAGHWKAKFSAPSGHNTSTIVLILSNWKFECETWERLRQKLWLCACWGLSWSHWIVSSSQKEWSKQTDSIQLKFNKMYLLKIWVLFVSNFVQFIFE